MSQRINPYGIKLPNPDEAGVEYGLLIQQGRFNTLMGS